MYLNQGCFRLLSEEYGALELICGGRINTVLGRINQPVSNVMLFSL